MTFYLFGNLAKGYTQYPNDYTKDIFSSLISNTKAQTQIVIRRDGNLMYYSYIRKLNQQQYIGISCVIGDKYLTQLRELFTLFESAIERLVEQGSIIRINQEGNYESAIQELYTSEEDIKDFNNILKSQFNELLNSAKALPPTDYSVSKDAMQSYCLEDDYDLIIRASYTYSNTFIYKDEDYESVRINSVRALVSDINKENNLLKQENERLQQQIVKVNKAKKQYKTVGFLVSLLLIGIGVAIYIYQELDDKARLQRERLTDNIYDLETSIESKNIETQNLSDELSWSESKRIKAEEAKREVESVMNNVFNYFPFIAYNFTVYRDRVTFDYYSPEEKNVSITLQAVDRDNGGCVTSSHTLSIEEGGGSKSLYFDYSINPQRYWCVFMTYQGNYICGKTW